MQRLERAEAVGVRLDRSARFRRSLLLVLRLEHRPDPQHLARSLKRAAASCAPLLSALRPYPCDVLTPKWVPHQTSVLGPQILPPLVDPTPGSRLQSFAPLLLQPFDAQAPLWNLWEVPSLESGDAAVILKLHPLVAGNLDWLSQLLEPGREPEPTRNTPEIAAAEEPWLSDISSAAREELGRHLARLRERVASAPGLARAPRQSLENLLGHLRGSVSLFGTGKRLADTRPGEAPFLSSLTVAWADLEECARVTRSSPREIIMTAVTNAMASERSHPVTCGLEDADYPWVAQQISLTSTSADPRRRIRELQHKIRPADADPTRTFLPEVAELLDRLPQPLLEAAADEFFASSDFRCDLQPGLPTPAFLAGAQVREIRSFQTTRGHRVAVSLIRSLENLSVGLTIDSRAFSEPERIVDKLREELATLLRLAG